MRVRFASFIILLILGCDRQPVVTVPTTAPARESTPASLPASLPSSSFIWIDQKRYEFPPVMLIIEKQDDGLLVQLMTNDPPEAMKDDYSGNSLFLSMTIDGPAEGSSIAGARWTYQAPNMEMAETISEIYLHGEHKVLQPFDVTATLLNADSPVGVAIQGTYLLFDEQDARSAPRKVAVMAELVAPVRSSERSAGPPAAPRPALTPVQP